VHVCTLYFDAYITLYSKLFSGLLIALLNGHHRLELCVSSSLCILGRLFWVDLIICPSFWCHVTAETSVAKSRPSVPHGANLVFVTVLVQSVFIMRMVVRTFVRFFCCVTTVVQLNYWLQQATACCHIHTSEIRLGPFWPMLRSDLGFEIFSTLKFKVYIMLLQTVAG